jgi:hypothetical protein
MAERTKKLPAPRALAAHAEAVVRTLHVLGLARVADLQRAVPELASVQQASKVVDGLIELEWLEEAEQRQADPLGGNGRPGRVLRPHTPELRTAVVLQALISLYTTHVVTLPPNAIGSCGMALAGMAGELMQISSTSTAAPSGTSFH